MSDLEPRRRVSQNRKMWPMLTDFAQQIAWPHQVQGQWTIGLMPPMAWKAVLTAAFEQETDMAQGLNGGTVMVGASTSNYGIKKMADFIEFLYSAGSEKGVIWSEKSEEIRREFGHEA